MSFARATGVSLALTLILAPIACGGDDPEGSASSSSSGGTSVDDGGPTTSRPDSSTPPTGDAGSDADVEPDAGPALAHGFLFTKGTETARVVRFFDPTDALGAVDASPPIDENWWDGIYATSSGDHFMYGDQDGRIFVGHARRGGAAADATGVPVAGAALGRANATLLEDGTLLYAGQYFEDGVVDVFRAGARLSTGAGRGDLADLGEATVALYGAGPTVAWTFSSDLGSTVYAAWGHTPGAEVEIDGADDIDAVAPSEDCLTFLPSVGVSTKIACRGAAVADLGAPVGSLAAYWHGAASRFAGFRPFGPNSAYVVKRSGNAWGALAAGDVSEVTVLARSPLGDRLVFRSDEAPINLLDMSQDLADYTQAVKQPSLGEDFEPFTAVFSPDGSQAVVLATDGAFVVTAGSDVAASIAVPEAESFTGAAWSPDGGRVLLGIRTAQGAAAIVVDKTGQQKKTVPTTALVQVRWASNDQIATLDESGALRVLPADGSGAAPAPIDTGVVSLLASIDVRIL